jgi:hypothetical protein
MLSRFGSYLSLLPRSVFSIQNCLVFKDEPPPAAMGRPVCPSGKLGMPRLKYEVLTRIAARNAERKALKPVRVRARGA